MTALDWALAVVWLGIALAGFWKGAVRLVLGVGGVVAGLWLAFAIGGDVAVRLEGWLGAGWIAAALGRVLPAVACIGLCLFAGWGISRTLEALQLGWLNRLAGALLAGGVGLIVLAVLLVAAVRTSPSLRELSGHSLLAPRLLAVWGLAVGPQAEVVDVSEEPVADAGGSNGR